MPRVVFLEVLDRRGRPKSRARFTSFPISIGRSYQNDVILADRYVSPAHIRIVESEAGELVAEDLGSLNGLHVHGNPDKLSRAVLRSGMRLRIGDTVIRLVDADQSVPPAEEMAPGSKGLLHYLGFKWVSLSVILLSLALFALDTYLAYYEELKWSYILGIAVGALIFLLVWAGMWSFTNRLLRHRFDFLRHAAFAHLIAVLMLVLGPLYEYIQFFFQNLSITQVLTYVGGALCLALLIMGHLAIIPSLTSRRRAAWSFGIALAVWGVAGLFQYASRTEHRSTIQTYTPLKALGANWLPATSLEEFLASARELKDEVDTLALEDDEAD